MGAELHIRVQAQAGDLSSILDQFPFEAGQQVILQNLELIMIDLGNADDTTYVQEWFLNSHDDVLSFYVVSDEEAGDEDE